jgi:hypothetical protein
MVRGKNPQSEEMIDEWRCAIALLPMLLVENAQMSRQTGAAMESFRNEMVNNTIGLINTAAAIVDRRLLDASHTRNRG